MQNFEEHLRNNTSKFFSFRKVAYGAVSDFFETMEEFPEFPPIPTKRRNPFLIAIIKNDGKLIPNDVILQWDRIMKNMTYDIPLELRTAYWILRTFPNRGTEVLSLNLDCLKTLFSYYVLNIPTWKQNGGYDIEEVKALPIMNHGHGGYLISLIQKVQKQTKERLSKFRIINDKNKRYLLLTFGFSLRKSDNNYIKTNYTQNHRTLKSFNNSKINKSFRQIADIFQIKDKNGNIYAPTTHQFRHNGITDRMHKASYTGEQTSVVSGHKSSKMMSSYYHPLKEVQKEILTKELKTAKDASVEVNSVFMNLDKDTVEMLNVGGSKYAVWEADGQKGVGICSNIIGCQPKGTPVMFECYGCDWFVPKAQYLQQYKNEHSFWEKVVKDTADKPKQAAVFENAIRNVNLIERIVNICESGIEKYEADLIEKIKKNEIQ